MSLLGLSYVANSFRSKYKLESLRDPTINSDKDFLGIYYACEPYTMTSTLRMYSLYQAVMYVCKSGISGDFVECGVWKGGSAMVIAKTLMLNGINDRRIFLYDTFGGMSKPTVFDVETRSQKQAGEKWKKGQMSNRNSWCFYPLEEVQNNLSKTGYPRQNIIYIKGRVEDTIPGTVPKLISLLRLDTDFYESTNHELEHLFPLLSKRGVLIIDDYGHWSGQKKAVEDYFNKNNFNILLNRIDYTGRIAVKS